MAHCHDSDEEYAAYSAEFKAQAAAVLDAIERARREEVTP